MLTRRLRSWGPIVLLCGLCTYPLSAATSWTLLGWSEFGINSVERDYSVFAISPPAVTIHAQLIDSTGTLVKSGASVKVTYSALADPSGSINSTSANKTNFWSFAKNLFGITVPPDTGITGSAMPGSGAQAMNFDASLNRFTADGIPMTPYDDNRNLNYYPMMKLTATDLSGNVLATTRITLPVSNEVECRGCHASNSNSAAMPLTGWANDPNPNRDFKLNILSLHDFKNKRVATYAPALAAAGYSANGLLATATAGTPVLCAACHSSNLLGQAGQSGISQLTTAMHNHHAPVIDPKTNDTLDNSTDRSACYNCHPGTATKALRGNMGHSVGANGQFQIQCQSCHGNLSALANPARVGYQDLPNCQACHSTSSPYRATTAITSSGTLANTGDTTFATTSNAPVAGAALYRYSTGHGGLQCAACHGSTHAEINSTQANDNLQALDLTGVAAPIRECTTCHKSGISSTNGGPHGMHQTGSSWVSAHPNVADRSRTACIACHGSNYQGTVLSQSFATRTLSTDFGTIAMFPGYQVSCYTCHNGPSGEGRNTTGGTVGTTASATATSGQPTTIAVNIASNTTPRIVQQPAYGTAYISNRQIVYQPFANFEGTDTLTYAGVANNKDSNLGTATITVTAASRPTFAPASVSNAASYAAGTVAPGMITLFTGKGLGPSTLATFELNSGGFIEKSVQSAQVSFDGVNAPLLYTLDGALAAIVPYSVAGKTSTSVNVQYNGISSGAVSVPVTAAIPGIFTADASGKGQAAALNQDGTLNSASNAAARGSIIVLYLTGDGIENPQPPDGLLTTSPYPATSGNVVVTIGGQPATVVYAGSAPGSVAGLMQINATIPANAPTGAVPVVVSVGGAANAGAVTIQVK